MNFFKFKRKFIASYYQTPFLFIDESSLLSVAVNMGDGNYSMLVGQGPTSPISPTNLVASMTAAGYGSIGANVFEDEASLREIFTIADIDSAHAFGSNTALMHARFPSIIDVSLAPNKNLESNSGQYIGSARLVSIFNFNSPEMIAYIHLEDLEASLSFITTFLTSELLSAESLNLTGTNLSFTWDYNITGDSSTSSVLSPYALSSIYTFITRIRILREALISDYDGDKLVDFNNKTLFDIVYIEVENA